MAYLGVDIGSISTKAVVLDETGDVVARSYLWTEGDPLGAVKRVLAEVESQVASAGVEVTAVGTTGSARELIGAALGRPGAEGVLRGHDILVLREVVVVHQPDGDMLAVEAEGHRAFAPQPGRELFIGPYQAIATDGKHNRPKFI